MKTVTDARGRPRLDGERVDLRWAAPPASDFAPATPLTGVRVVRRTRSFPLTPTDGDVVYDGPVVSELSDGGLEPLTTYYYTIFTRELGVPPLFHADDRARVAVFATARYDLPRRLYELLPAVHLRHDRPLGPADVAQLAQSNPALPAALAALAPDLRTAGQLRRFLHAAAAPADLMRSLAEGLKQVQVADVTRPEFLAPLGSFVGWEVDATLPVEAQRNEVKFAPHVYRRVGTVPSIRALVSRYTGWHTQLAEFAEHVVRSNEPAQLNVFAIAETKDGWRGADDAAPALGFGAGTTATGTAATHAVLTGTAAEPFPLRPGMELAVAADGRLPTVVRFRAGDFASIGAATAAEVSAVLERTLSEVSARAVAGKVELSSHSVGTSSSVAVERYAASLVTLEGAPRGRLAAVLDAAGRARLLYETADPLEDARREAAARAAAGAPVPVGVPPGRVATTLPESVGSAPAERPSLPHARLRAKTFRGEWGASLAVPTSAPAGDPAAVELPDGRLLAAWIAQPGTDAATVRAALGTTRAASPAILPGRRGEPFRIVPGSTLVVRGTWDGPTGIELVATDFADAAHATAAEVRTALQARLRHVTTTTVNGTVVLHSNATGGDARLEVDLDASSAAVALGFGPENASARGDTGDAIDWGAAHDASPAGRKADLTACVEAGGAVRLFWAEHAAGVWRIATARWDGVTSPPVWSAPAVVAEGGGGAREPAAVVGQPNKLWLLWAQRAGVGTSEDVWTLQRAVLDLAANTWAPPAPVTTAAVPRSRDREPAPVVLPSGDVRVLFRSDRGGGDQIWSVVVAGGGAVTPPVQITSGAYVGVAPAPLLVGGNLWILYRSDRSVPLSRVGSRELPPVENRITLPRAAAADPPGPLRSVVAADTGTIRRFAGSVTIVPGDTSRLARRRLFGDAIAYTPQGTGAGDVLRHDDYYTRGTVGLYLSRLIPDTPLTQQKVERLTSILTRFLPINVRAVVIFAPRFDVEFVYDGVDIDERVHDEYPEIDYYTGAGETKSVDLLPDWVLFRSAAPPAAPTHLAFDPARPTTLRHRSWHRIYFPPPV